MILIETSTSDETKIFPSTEQTEILEPKNSFSFTQIPVLKLTEKPKKQSHRRDYKYHK